MQSLMVNRAMQLESIGRILIAIQDGNLQTPLELVNRFAVKTFNPEERKVLAKKIKDYKDSGKIAKFHPTSLSLVLLEGVDAELS